MFLEVPNIKRLNRFLNEQNSLIKIIADQQEFSNDLFIEIALKDLRKIFDYDNDKKGCSAWSRDKLEVRLAPKTFRPIYIVNHRNSRDMDCNGNTIVSFTLTHSENDNEIYKKDDTKVYFLLDQDLLEKIDYKRQSKNIDESDRILYGCIVKDGDFWDCDYSDFIKEKVWSHIKFCGYDLDNNFKIVKWKSKKFDQNLRYTLDQLNCS